MAEVFIVFIFCGSVSLEVFPLGRREGDSSCLARTQAYSQQKRIYLKTIHFQQKSTFFSKKKYIYSMIFIIISRCPVRCETSINQAVIEFCSNNGLKFVTFLRNTSYHEKTNLFKEASKNVIRSSKHMINVVENDSLILHFQIKLIF